ncbi:proteasome regulatory particle subunit RPN11 [Nowakowskiella sp. JEL0407]|nr:proteasome regulatory particle subunit RPN11 [Nowakowskiella sp. JEL0407]
MAGEVDARKRFELENEITESSSDNIYFYDENAQRQTMNARPWSKDPHHFKKVKINAIALIKMAMHARSGGSIEVMGILQGKVQNDTMIIMDAFALPVEGTETRVNAAAEGNEYMVDYLMKTKDIGRLENACGWYHSHPGYGCWLSGIDVSTQMLNQQFQDPWVAVVIDPNRTISAGKVEIGAFRTYPANYTPPNEGPSEYQTIPLSKIEDFGVHSKKYYQLEVSYFKSKLDAHLLELLWHKYWVNTLSSSPLVTNREHNARQILDLAEKIEQADASMSASKMGSIYGGAEKKKSDDSALKKVEHDSTKISIEANHGIMTQVLKHVLFNTALNK